MLRGLAMLIRPCRLADAAEVAALAGELGYPTDAGQAAARLERLLGAADGAVLVAEAGPAALAGWIHVREMLTPESDAFAEIAGLVVTASRRGQGIGRALVAAGLDWAVRRGLATMRVRSSTLRTETHRWYEVAGFTRQKTQAVFSRPASGGFPERKRAGAPPPAAGPTA
jgi:GNAT superfamily N-acetyltransferase